MTSNYSEALEQQIAMWRYVGTPAARQSWMAKAAMLYGGANATDYYDASCYVLGRAAPFFWAADLTEFLLGAAAKMPAWAMREDVLPSSFGFVWFARPLRLPHGDKPARDLTAFSWGNIAPDTQGMWITTYVQDSIREAGVPSTIGLWDYGKMHPAIFEAASDQTSLSNERWTLQARYIAAALLFMQQSIFVTSTRRAERHVRKRAEREGWNHEPLIRVVELRREERLGEHRVVESVERDWNCQWVVRGHWRQQPYPKDGDVRPIWITPYVKGPEDKPLKPPRATVFAVVR